MPKKILLNSKKIDLILNRLVCELIENHKDFNNTVLIGLQPRGTYLIEKILNIFKKKYPKINIKSGILDFTFFIGLLITSLKCKAVLKIKFISDFLRNLIPKR